MRRPFPIEDKRIIITLLVAWCIFMLFALDIRPLKLFSNSWVRTAHPLYNFSLELDSGEKSAEQF